MSNQKQFYLFVDESGKFESEKQDSSLVGGFVTEKDPNEILKEVQEFVTSFQEKHPNILTMKDIHAAEVLHPEYFYKNSNNLTEEKEKRKKRYLEIGEDIKKNFFEGIRDIILKNSLFWMSAKSISFSFAEEKAQTKYGYALKNLLEKIKLKLKEKFPNEFIKVYFSIATRHEDCLPENRDWKKYHEELESFIKKQFKIFKEYKTKDIKNLLNLADVVCYYSRTDHREFKHEKIIREELSDEGFISFKQNFQTNLIKKKEIYLAYLEAKKEEDKKNLLTKLEEISAEKINYQIDIFLNYAHELVQQRNLQNKNLEEAKIIFEAILKICNKNEKLKSQKKSCISGLIELANHSGAIDQEKIVKLLKKEDIDLGKPFFVRYSEWLELKNRLLNIEFNSYQFDKIEKKFLQKIEEYQSALDLINEENKSGTNKCYLLHKMYSSIGQSYAFLGNFEKAKEYFEKSLKHRTVKSDFRTVNYLITLFWHCDKNEEAINVWNKYKDDNLTRENILENLYNTLESKKQNYLFESSLLLRLYISFYSFKEKYLKKIDKKLEQLKNDQHPMQLIYKWLGIGYLSLEDYQKAISLFKKAQEIKGDFTLKTIRIINLTLELFCMQQGNDRKDEKNKTNLEAKKEQLKNEIEECIKISPSFGDYVSHEKLENLMNAKDYQKLSKVLPFSYS